MLIYLQKEIIDRQNPRQNLQLKSSTIYFNYGIVLKSVQSDNI